MMSTLNVFAMELCVSLIAEDAYYQTILPVEIPIEEHVLNHVDGNMLYTLKTIKIL